jgi:hypothetical protein
MASIWHVALVLQVEVFTSLRLKIESGASFDCDQTWFPNAFSLCVVAHRPFLSRVLYVHR